MYAVIRRLDIIVIWPGGLELILERCNLQGMDVSLDFECDHAFFPRHYWF